VGKHTDTHYLLVIATGKGKNRKEHTERIPWDSINDTELVQLALREHKELRLNMETWDVAHRGQRNQVLIDLIRGVADTTKLTPNPVHRTRESIHLALKKNWKHLETQIRCSAICASCLDLKPLECYLDNEYLMRRDDRGALD